MKTETWTCDRCKKKSDKQMAVIDLSAMNPHTIGVILNRMKDEKDKYQLGNYIGSSITLACSDMCETCAELFFRELAELCKKHKMNLNWLNGIKGKA